MVRYFVVGAVLVGWFCACASASPPSGDATDAGTDAAKPLAGYENCKTDDSGCPFALCDCPSASKLPLTSRRRTDGTCNLDFADVCKLLCPDPSKNFGPPRCYPKDDSGLFATDGGPAKPTDAAAKTCTPGLFTGCDAAACDCKNGERIIGPSQCKDDGTCPSLAEECPKLCAPRGGWQM